MNETANRIRQVKWAARIALAVIWLYEGLVPKLLYLSSDQMDLVARSGLIWRSSAWTLQILGVAQIAMGFWLLSGLAERAAVLVATIWMCLLIVLVARGNPTLLTDPYGALVKDFSLIASAYAVWIFSANNHATESM